jgi:hypothetical protein
VDRRVQADSRVVIIPSPSCIHACHRAVDRTVVSVVGILAHWLSRSLCLLKEGVRPASRSRELPRCATYAIIFLHCTSNKLHITRTSSAAPSGAPSPREGSRGPAYMGAEPRERGDPAVMRQLLAQR